MTRKIAKAVLSFVMILFLLFLNLFGIGDYLYPDNASLFEGEKLESVLCFSCKTATDQEERVLAFGIIPIKDVSVTFYENREVLCGGDLFGIRMESKGLLVTGVDSVESDGKSLFPGKDAGLKKGDVLCKGNGMELKSASAFSKLIAKSD